MKDFGEVCFVVVIKQWYQNIIIEILVIGNTLTQKGMYHL